MTKFDQLREFIATKMRMSHVYQPLMLKTLLRSHGRASVGKIAKALLAQDRSQIEYYEQVTHNMVGRVLRNRHVVERDGQEYRLTGFETLSEAQIDELVQLCDERLSQYIAKRGQAIWSHRATSAGYVSGTLRYEVLKRARFRCELCGISAKRDPDASVTTEAETPKLCELM